MTKKTWYRKPIIAIDVDDVLSESLDALRREVNKRVGTEFELHDYHIEADYHGYAQEVWQRLGLDNRISMDELNADKTETRSNMEPHNDAKTVLQELAKDYRLVVITARDPNVEVVTRMWLDRHFTGLFNSVAFTGARDDPNCKEKGDMCVEIGAKWLIDDSVEHCISAQAKGVQPILFGDYGWHHKAPADLVKAKDWQAVLAYFKDRVKV